MSWWLFRLVQQEFDHQFFNDDQIEAEAKVKRILEKRIEELNTQKLSLHAKIVGYGSTDDKEMQAIAEEYRML